MAVILTPADDNLFTGWNPGVLLGNGFGSLFQLSCSASSCSTAASSSCLFARTSLLLIMMSVTVSGHASLESAQFSWLNDNVFFLQTRNSIMLSLSRSGMAISNFTIYLFAFPHFLTFNKSKSEKARNFTNKTAVNASNLTQRHPAFLKKWCGMFSF